MGRQEILEEALKLPLEDQERLARDIQNSIEESEAAELELTVEQYRELMERAAKCERDPNIGTPWHIVKARMKVKA